MSLDLHATLRRQQLPTSPTVSLFLSSFLSLFFLSSRTLCLAHLIIVSFRPVVDPVLPRFPRRRHDGLDIVPIYVEREPYSNHYMNPPNDGVWLRNDRQNVCKPEEGRVGNSVSRTDATAVASAAEQARTHQE